MQLSAFVPKERDFSNEYQFKMHQSWLEKGGFKANIPANFSETSISKTFTNAENKRFLSSIFGKMEDIRAAGKSIRFL